MSAPPRLYQLTCRLSKFSPERIRRLFQLIARYTTPRAYLLLATTSSNSAHHRCARSAWQWRVEQILDYFEPSSNVHTLYRDGLYYNAYRAYYRAHRQCRANVLARQGGTRANHCLPASLQQRVDELCEHLVVRTVRLDKEVVYGSAPAVPSPVIASESALLHIEPDSYPIKHHTLDRVAEQTHIVAHNYDAQRVSWAFLPEARRVDFFVDSTTSVCSYALERGDFIENPGLLLCSAFTYDSEWSRNDDNAHAIERDGTIFERTRTRDVQALRSDTCYIDWSLATHLRRVFEFLVDPMTGRWPWSSAPIAVPPLPFNTSTLAQIRSSPRRIVERCRFYLLNEPIGAPIDRVGRILVLHVLMTNPTLKRSLGAMDERAPLPQVTVETTYDAQERRRRRLFRVHVGVDQRHAQVEPVDLDLAPFLTALATLSRSSVKRKAV